jgi:hypothetical protein
VTTQHVAVAKLELECCEERRSGAASYAATRVTHARQLRLAQLKVFKNSGFHKRGYLQP